MPPYGPRSGEVGAVLSCSAASSGAEACSGTGLTAGSLGLAVNVGRVGGAVSSSSAGATMLPIPVVKDRPSSSAAVAV